MAPKWCQIPDQQTTPSMPSDGTFWFRCLNGTHWSGCQNAL